MTTGRPGRAFGLLFAALFAGVAAWPLLSGEAPRTWSVALAAAFLATGAVRPGWLVPLERAWMRLGVMLGHVFAPIALGVVFFLVLTPTALLMRLAGKDPMRMRSRAASSYWIEREDGGEFAPESFRRLF